MSGWIKSAATHYIRAKYVQRVLYQLPMSVSEEAGKTGRETGLGRDKQGSFAPLSVATRVMMT